MINQGPRVAHLKPAIGPVPGLILGPRPVPGLVLRGTSSDTSL